jgi:hypothetical protein
MARVSFIFVALLAFLLQPRMFHRASATAVSAPSLGKQDILDFWATQNWLQFMANLFAQENYSHGPDRYAATDRRRASDASDTVFQHLFNCA